MISIYKTRSEIKADKIPVGTFFEGEIGPVWGVFIKFSPDTVVLMDDFNNSWSRNPLIKNYREIEDLNFFTCKTKQKPYKDIAEGTCFKGSLESNPGTFFKMRHGRLVKLNANKKHRCLDSSKYKESIVEWYEEIDISILLEK